MGKEVSQALLCIHLLCLHARLWGCRASVQGMGRFLIYLCFRDNGCP